MSDVKYIFVEAKSVSAHIISSLWRIEPENLSPASAGQGILTHLSILPSTDISHFIVGDNIHDRDVMEMVHGKKLVDTVEEFLPHLRDMNIGMGIWCVNSEDIILRTGRRKTQ